MYPKSSANSLFLVKMFKEIDQQKLMKIKAENMHKDVRFAKSELRPIVQ